MNASAPIVCATAEIVANLALREGEHARIDQVVYVTRPGHKGIALGKRGETIKAVGQAARADLAEFLGRPVHLFLTVKVRPGWLEERERYGEIGLDFSDGEP